MYTKGHCGVTLLAYTPVGFGLLLTGHESAAFTGGVIMLSLMMVPDCDHLLPSLHHRGPTHTLLFAILVGTLLGLGTAAFVPYQGTPVEGGLFAFAIGSLAVVAHLMADLLTPMGIEPFWPVSNRRYSLELTSANDTTANYGLLGLGVLVTASGLYLLGGVA